MVLAAREVVEETMGFSPNDLVLGHKVWGPLSIFQDGIVDRYPPIG